MHVELYIESCIYDICLFSNLMGISSIEIGLRAVSFLW